MMMRSVFKIVTKARQNKVPISFCTDAKRLRLSLFYFEPVIRLFFTRE